MISCHSRRASRRDSLDSLAKVGITPVVVESACSPASSRENRRVGLEAIARADGEGVLFLEDDIRARGTFPAFLELAVDADIPVSFCNLDDAFLKGDTRSDLAGGGLVRPRIERGGNTSRWWGSQAVYLPTRIVRLVEAYQPRRERAGYGFDFLLADTLTHHEIPLYFAIPNPVQHEALPSVVAGKGKPRRSTSAHRRTDRPMRYARVEGLPKGR